MVRCLDKVTFSNRTDFIMKSRQDSGYERRINRAVGKTSSTLIKKVRYENKGRKQLDFSFSRFQDGQNNKRSFDDIQKRQYWKQYIVLKIVVSKRLSDWLNVLLDVTQNDFLRFWRRPLPNWGCNIWILGGLWEMKDVGNFWVNTANLIVFTPAESSNKEKLSLKLILKWQ